MKEILKPDKGKCLTKLLKKIEDKHKNSEEKVMIYRNLQNKLAEQ